MIWSAGSLSPLSVLRVVDKVMEEETGALPGCFLIIGESADDDEADFEGLALWEPSTRGAM